MTLRHIAPYNPPSLSLLAALVAAISTINATVLSSPRILFAMGRDGLLPSCATAVNGGGTPMIALSVGTVVAGILVLSGIFDTLVAIAAILFVVVYLPGFVSLFLLRAREPQLSRPFKAWFYPWGNLLVLTGIFRDEEAGSSCTSANALTATVPKR